jgi:hypothetical protein
MFIDAIDTLISKLNENVNNETITYDTLDRVLWYVGKIYRGNLSLILSREEYDKFTKQFTNFDIEKVDLDRLPIEKNTLLYDFFALAKELKTADK